MLILVFTYPLFKRVTYWPQLILGLTFNWGALMGWTAITGSISLSPILLYLLGIFWTLGYDTIYAHQDREDDALIGVKSSALFLGDKTKLFLVAFYGTTLSGLLAIGLLNNQGRYLAIGTGGEVRVSTAELVAREIRIIGSFVGNFTDLVEVTNLTLRGDLISKVSVYPLNEVNRALHDLRDGKILGRAVLVPN